jgi:predicted nucleic acid-binding Zn ribbon protein
MKNIKLDIYAIVSTPCFVNEMSPIILTFMIIFHHAHVLGMRLSEKPTFCSEIFCDLFEKDKQNVSYTTFLYNRILSFLQMTLKMSIFL